jgi:hypothetical protein
MYHPVRVDVDVIARRFVGSPGMVVICPSSGCKKRAPADKRTFLTVTVRAVGRSLSSRRENRCIFATQIGG